MSDAQIDELDGLYDAFKTACRRMDAARGRLTRVIGGRSDEKISGALARLRARQAEAGTVLNAFGRQHGRSGLTGGGDYGAQRDAFPAEGFAVAARRTRHPRSGA